MSASPIWTVHCNGCGVWYENEQAETKAGAESLARSHGWFVSPRRGRPNFCLECKTKEF